MATNVVAEDLLIVYIAGPLFTHAERVWNALLAHGLRQRGYQVILPQEGADRMLRGQVAFDAEDLFKAAVDGVDRCDVVLAVLDGSDPDSGTSWECGYAWKSGRPIIGIRTDMRPGGDDASRPVNLMLARSCREFVRGALGDAGVDRLLNEVDDALRALHPARPGKQ